MSDKQIQAASAIHAPKSAPKAPAQAEPPTVAEMAAAAAAACRAKGGGFDPVALKAADATVTAAVEADDGEVGRFLVGRGRKALKAKLTAILDPEDNGSN